MTDEVETPTGTPEHFSRLHPLTPLLKGWGYLVAAIAFAAQDSLRAGEFSYGLLIAAGVAVIGGLAATVSWWFTRYGFDGDALRIDSGILNRTTRRVKMDRLQSVDIDRPLAARLFGLSQLKMELAGGSDSDATLAYLPMNDAAALRAELLARAAGLDAETPEAPERPVYKVVLRDLVWSTILSGTFVIGVLVVIGLGVAFIVAPSPAEVAGVVLSTMVPGLIAIGAALWNQLGRNFDFTLAESPDGYRIRKGLLDTRAQTVPPGRVQGVALVQPLLWRLRGWVKLDVDVAGYAGAGADEQQRASTLLPVATYDEALSVMTYVLRGADMQSVPLHAAPRSARWLRPITAPRLAYGADERIAVSREGRLVRRLYVVPHARNQSVRLTQGPLQRRLDLATVHIDTTPGPVDARFTHRAAKEARRILDEQVARASHARAVDQPEQWMTRAEGPPETAARSDEET